MRQFLSTRIRGQTLSPMSILSSSITIIYYHHLSFFSSFAFHRSFTLFPFEVRGLPPALFTVWPPSVCPFVPLVIDFLTSASFGWGLQNFDLNEKPYYQSILAFVLDWSMILAFILDWSMILASSVRTNISMNFRQTSSCEVSWTNRRHPTILVFFFPFCIFHSFLLFFYHFLILSISRTKKHANKYKSFSLVLIFQFYLHRYISPSNNTSLRRLIGDPQVLLLSTERL